MTIRVCVAGATGWTGSAVTGGIIASASGEFQLVGAVARREAGRDIGEVLGLGRANVKIAASLEEALAVPTDVLIDYTGPDVVKGHILTALDIGVRVVVGTSGLTASDYTDIEQRAIADKLGVIAAGNFSIPRPRRDTLLGTMRAAARTNRRLHGESASGLSLKNGAIDARKKK